METTAFLATNYHVIENALDAVEVTVNNARTYDALVLGWDADKDVAVLAICCSNSFIALPWEEASPNVGAEVVAVGYPSRWFKNSGHCNHRRGNIARRVEYTL